MKIRFEDKEIRLSPSKVGIDFDYALGVFYESI